MSTKPQLLILSTWFAPAFRAGGPVTSLRNLVLRLEHDMDITVITGARDLGEPQNLKGIVVNTPQAYSQATVVYTSNLFWTLWWCFKLRKQAGTAYYNDIYSLRFFLLPRLLWAVFGASKKHILALRGMLLPGALSIKARKKKVFLNLFKTFQQWFPCQLHYTGVAEQQAAAQWLPKAKGRTIQNLPGAIQEIQPNPKQRGRLILCFLGRVVPIKNLAWLLDAVAPEAPVELHVYGILEDATYWKEVQAAFSKKQITLRYHQSYTVAELPQILSTVDMVYCPSQSENYGHAMVQALCHGIPVIATKNAPWGSLEDYHAGILVDPDKPRPVAMQQLIEASERNFILWRQGAQRFAQEIIHNTHTKSEYLDFFTAAV